MSYSYRPSQTKLPLTNQNITNPVENTSSKQISKEQLKTYESIFILIGYVVKINITKNVKESFSKIKTIISRKKKYSYLLLKKIHFLFKQKQRQFTNMFFSTLLANRIQFYNKQVQHQKQLKNHSQNKATGLIFLAVQKLFNQNYKTVFNQLKKRCGPHSKARNLKATIIIAKLCFLYRKQLALGFKCLFDNKLSVKKKGKVANRLQTFVGFNNKKRVLTAFSLLKSHFYRNKLKQAIAPQEQPLKTQSKQPPKGFRSAQTVANKSQSQRKQLEQQIRQLEKNIAEVERGNSTNLSSLKMQIQKVQKQNQSLRFNNDLLEQNNSQLQKQIQSYQQRSRKKLKKNQIWESVYDNFIYFLALNKHKPITKEQLIQCLQTPLTVCNQSLDELNEENQILADLLAEYKKSFPKPQNLNSSHQMSYLQLKKKNKYFYMVLEVLSEWGFAGSKDFESLNHDLSILQKKLAE